jgi:phosphonate transport system substrate-binding protein
MTFKLPIQIILCLLILSLSNVLLAKSADKSVRINTSPPLIIGVFPRRDPALTIRLFKPLKNYLEQHTNHKFILETSPDFSSFRKNLQLRHYDLVHFNQFHYVKSHEKLSYEVLAQNEEFGEKTIRGGIFVRKDSGIDSLQQLRGKSILFGGGKEAMMSYIVPRYLLAQSGLQQNDYKTLFASSPPNSILATYTRQVIASGAGEVATRLPVVTSKIDNSQLKALSLSNEMAHLPWAIKQELPDALKHQIKNILINLKHSEEGLKILKAAKLTALNPVTDKDYNPHREIINYLETDQSETN